MSRFETLKLNAKTGFVAVIFFFHLFTVACAGNPAHTSVGWPEINAETKPWTRWWWLGNSVQLETLPQLMEEYKNAGLGGLEITPIYGVRGDEENFVDYLSPEWANLLTSTLRIADSLNLGIDMANASGWPFGGPWIDSDDACKNFVYEKYAIQGGQTVDRVVAYMQEPFVSAVRRNVNIDDIRYPLNENNDLYKLALSQIRFRRTLPVVALIASSGKGDTVDLTDKLDAGNRLRWEAPAGEWTLYAVFRGWHGKLVERASPGGEGNVIDHFSKKALRKHLSSFDTAFKGKDIRSLRAFFNDSYEVDDAEGEANFTGNLFEEFKKRRGYDLRMHLPSFLEHTQSEEHKRILCDYRETISDLLLEEFTLPWKEWAYQHAAITRNQAHGSPANILDLYAASGIPETEGTDLINIKFASSAAHLTGKKLTSAEACTWLNEHFRTTLAQVKENVDNFFLGGVNHIVYHGTAYSPLAEEWPGRLFYAAVHFEPANPFWDDFSALNRYVARCQSFLQSGYPDNDMLIYYPVHDRWSTPSQSLLTHFHGEAGDTFLRTFCSKLMQSGYSFDFISDKQVKTLSVKNNRLVASHSVYKTIVVPDARLMPLETFEALLNLARRGARIVFINTLPDDIPGLDLQNERRGKYFKLRDGLEFSRAGNSGVQKSKLGKGFLYKSADEGELFAHLDIRVEPMAKDSLRFIRRKLENGETAYFIVNTGKNRIDKWIELNNTARAILCYNPMTGEYGKALKKEGGAVYMQLNPGDACILRLLPHDVKTAGYRYVESGGETIAIEGDWNVEFIKGGPELPPALTMTTLKSWTETDDEAYKRFSGKAVYTVRLHKPTNSNAEAWLLDLGEVCESASVVLNNRELGVCIKAPYQLVIDDSDLSSVVDNVLEIRVSNLMANRIAYMDKQKTDWKKFYDINFPAKNRENLGEDRLFNAGGWQPAKSGLIGPVRLTPLRIKKEGKAEKGY